MAIFGLLWIGTGLETQAQGTAEPQAEEQQAAIPPSEDAFLSFRLDEWTVDEGIPGNVSSFTQTPDGYLWITTWAGLARFDGYRFTVYNKSNTPAFTSHAFTRL